MDSIDRQIIAHLQSDGRMSITDLASRIGLTVSPTHRRVRDLEASGAIAGYRAIVDPAALGLAFEALVFISMHQEDRATIQAFEEQVAALPQVLLAQRLFGDPDYLLRIRTKDMESYTRLQDDVLSALPGVQKMTSTLVMKSFVSDRPLPTGRA